ncbi:unnamed protein product [Caenorhabditis auriculariae]|uniref:Uncharacterized protein n=1 Tax=Caenorhabditis auriculariae TaxID=2777116 RepID=A0A8S1HJS5_9PELO|nr:unnamed protein product [Caenorhabditis auriculariae]
MNPKLLWSFTLIGLLLIASVDCKKNNSKDVKSYKKIRDLKHVKKDKPEKRSKLEAVDSEKVVFLESHESAKEGPTHYEKYPSSNEEEQRRSSDGRRQMLKPRALKVLAAYEQCKQECRRQRNEAQTQEYVEQLRQQLQAAETVSAAEEHAEEDQDELHYREPIHTEL